MLMIEDCVSLDDRVIQEFTRQTCHGRWMNPEFEPGMVSVVIMTYNRAYALSETMDSVFAQTYRPIELIVVDDGSTDKTQTLVEEWGGRSSEDHQFHLRYFHQAHQGATAARNLGLIKSRGEYIQFLGSDDLLGSEKIQNQMIVGLSQPDVILCGPWMYFWEEKGRRVKRLGKIIDLNGDIVVQWLEHKFFTEHALLWPRRTIYRLGPWDESLAKNQDGDYFIRAVLKGMRFLFTPDAFSYYRIVSNCNSMSKDVSLAAINSNIKVIQKLRFALEEKGNIEQYRGMLAAWFYKMSKEIEVNHPETARLCFQGFKVLWPDRPCSLIGRFATRILGQHTKETLSRIVWRVIKHFRHLYKNSTQQKTSVDD